MPSILSKFDQKLWEKLIPKTAEINTADTNTVKAVVSKPHFGQYLRKFIIKSTAHAVAIISTIIRKAKFFPLMNGKNVESATINKVKGNKYAPTRIIQ